MQLLATTTSCRKCDVCTIAIEQVLKSLLLTFGLTIFYPNDYFVLNYWRRGRRVIILMWFQLELFILCSFHYNTTDACIPSEWCERLHLPRLTGYYWFSLLFLLLSPVRIEWTTFSLCELCSNCCSTYRPKENWFFSLRVLMCVLLWHHHNLQFTFKRNFYFLCTRLESFECWDRSNITNTSTPMNRNAILPEKKNTIILESTEEHLSAKASCRNEQKAPALMTPTGERNNQKHTRTIWFSLFFCFQ